MRKSIVTTVGIVLIGICGALYLGYTIQNENPEGILLYTPANGDPGQKTPGFKFGMFIGTAVATNISILISLVSFVMGKLRASKVALFISTASFCAAFCLGILTIGIIES